MTTTKMELRMRGKRRVLFTLCQAAAITVLLTATLQAQIKILHAFRGSSDGANPAATLVRDPSGNLYGTTLNGGGKGCRPYGCGTVFEVTPGGRQRTLYAFTGVPDGKYPNAEVVLDSSGNLYGTTLLGGQANLGTVFKLDTQGNETILHDFTGEDGASPPARLLRDTLGNLYGTTEYGGAYRNGTVFKIDAAGQYTVLHSFSGPPDGSQPLAALIRDAQGNLYGTTFSGGDTNCSSGGCGTVFELDTFNRETILHRFSSTDGEFPASPLIRDSNDNLYGMTTRGGDLSCPQGCGVIFKLNPSGEETILHSFAFVEGYVPYGPFARDSAGNIFGAAADGGASCGASFYGCGTIFELDSGGTLTVLQTFHDDLYGALPIGILLDATGNIFGTAQVGGNAKCIDPLGCGVVFEIPAR